MEQQHQQQNQQAPERKGQKRKLEDAAASASASAPAADGRVDGSDFAGGDREGTPCEDPWRALAPDVKAQVDVLDATFSWKESDRAAAKRATHTLAQLAKNEEAVNVIVEGGAVPALVRHLQAPPMSSMEADGDCRRPFEHEVEKGSALALGLLAVNVTMLPAIRCLLYHPVALCIRHVLGEVIGCDMRLSFEQFLI